LRLPAICHSTESDKFRMTSLSKQPPDLRSSLSELTGQSSGSSLVSKSITSELPAPETRKSQIPLAEQNEASFPSYLHGPLIQGSRSLELQLYTSDEPIQLMERQTNLPEGDSFFDERNRMKSILKARNSEFLPKQTRESPPAIQAYGRCYPLHSGETTTLTYPIIFIKGD